MTTTTEPIAAGYSEDDLRKAKVFFDRAATVAGTGNYDYSIELYIQGLNIFPESVDAHQALRDVSLKRKATGGKALGMLKAMGLKNSKDDKLTMLNQEKLLAYDPGNISFMSGLLQAAHRADYVKTVMWIAPILQRANVELPNPDIKQFLILKDVYKGISQFKLAIDALNYATQLRPDDMDLGRELKDLAAENTMKEGRYATAGNFTDSVKDRDQQERLMDQDKDVRTVDAMSRVIAEAEAQYRADPLETGKILKYVELLAKTDDSENENKAIELLDESYKRTKQFRFRMQVGHIKMKQLKRMGRTLLETVRANPTDKALIEDYRLFEKDRATEELSEFQLAAEAYPTDLIYRYEMAKRLFELQRYGEAIPVFQQARSDPKFRTDATLMLGRAFLDAEFVEEAVDTLKALLDSYELKGDHRHTDMTYWYGRALEQKGDRPTAIKAFSQVAMADFNYKDVQTRIKALRSQA